MHVIVLGAGVIGVTSAWYLRQAGYAVTVLDRQPGPGLETSYANGGQISVSHPEPWANPGAPRQVWRWLGREDAPLLFRPSADWRQWAWGLRFLLECLPARASRNTAAIARLARHSQQCLAALRTDAALTYDRLDTGILHLFFEAHDYAQVGPRAELLRGLGIEVERLDAAGCLAAEPALAASRRHILGGLYARSDETGDAHQFTRALAQRCGEAGVTFLFGHRVVALECARRTLHAVRAIDADGRTVRVGGDRFVLALGSHAPLLVRPLGEALPVYPVKGYSVTLPLAQGAQAPRVSITDETRRVVYSRLGNRLRIAGTAELNGYDDAVNPARCGAILRCAEELFPQIATAGEAEFWAGLRPATPGNVPIIGRSMIDGLYFNTGHGTLGWTLACGSAHALAGLIEGKTPATGFPFRGL